MPMTGSAPLPYKKTDKTPNLGCVDQSDDIRGGMGFEGLTKLAKFVQEGGTLITEGSTSTIFPEYAIYVAASPSRRRRSCSCAARSCAACSPTCKSPIAYGYDGSDLPVYFNQAPVLNAGGGGIPPEFAAFAGGGGAATRGLGQNITPNAQPLRLSPLEPEPAADGDAPPAGGCRGASSAAMAAQFGDHHSTMRVRASCCRSRRTRTTCCCRARWRTASSWPTARRSWTRRSARATW